MTIIITFTILNTGHIHKYTHVIVPRSLSTIPALQMCTSTTLALKYNVQAALCFLYSIAIVFTDTRKVLVNSIDTVIIKAARKYLLNINYLQGGLTR